MGTEAAKLQREKPQRNSKTYLLESLAKAGAVGLHMGAALGTEVPEHKVWGGGV